MKHLLLLLLITFCLNDTRAQENNYWNAQYGCNSSLLGGAVVSSYCDNGALFYNPATVAFKDSGTISISANVYKLEDTKLSNVLGNGIDMKNFNYGILPQLISGSFHTGKKTELGFIIITRNDVDFVFSQALHSISPMMPTNWSPDTVRLYDYLASFEGRTRIYETWGGLSGCYRVNEHFSLGMTHFLTYRYQKFQRNINITALGLNDTSYSYSANFQSLQNVLMNNFSYLLKLGAAFKSDRMDAGIAITLPSLHLGGIGNATSEWYLNNSTQYGNDSYLLFDKENNRPFKYKTPFSVALGTCIKFPKTKLYLSGEYFAPIDPYSVFSPVTDTSYKSNKIVRFNADSVSGITKFANPVFNFAVGMEQKLNPKLNLLLGFNSDFSAVNPDNVAYEYNDISYTYINLWHFSAGFKIISKKKIVSIGLLAAYGHVYEQLQFADLRVPSDIEENQMMGYPQETADFRYRGIALVLGVNY